MSINTSFRFHSGSNLPDQLIDFFMMYLLAEGLNIFRNKILKHDFDIRRSFGWLKIGYHFFSIIFFATIEYKFEKNRLFRPLARICKKLTFYNMNKGLMTFVKTEPELSKTIFEIIGQLYDDYQVYKTTGVKTKLLQRYLPDLI